jgi:hypothetical protein
VPSGKLITELPLLDAFMFSHVLSVVLILSTKNHPDILQIQPIRGQEFNPFAYGKALNVALR